MTTYFYLHFVTSLWNISLQTKFILIYGKEKRGSEESNYGSTSKCALCFHLIHEPTYLYKQFQTFQP